MKKRILSVLMCLCLLISSVTSLGIAVSADSSYVLAELDYMVNGVKMVNSYKELLSHGVTWENPVDLTALGYGEKNLGLQIDFFVTGGDLDMVKKAAGQIELTSSGGGDAEEIYWNTGDIDWKDGEWVREVFPMNAAHTTGAAFRPEALNYMRIYFVGLEEKFVSEEITLKIGNVRVVDMDATAPSLEEDPLGFTVSTEGYFLYDLDYKITGTKTIGADGMIAETSIKIKEPLNFTEVGFDSGNLGLQMDVFTAGCIDAPMNSWGQIEFSSSGDRDRQEFSTSVEKVSWREGKWVRQVIPFSVFGYQTTSELDFDPSYVDYFRMYFFTDAARSGEKLVFKVCNVRVVDMSKSAPTYDEDPVGDGSFTPDAPVWEQVTVGDEYNKDDIVVSGYNLGDYLEPNTDTDATPYVQSLLEGLAAAGGGTLYIPAGEYVFEGELIIPDCTTIYGEWQNPEKDPEAKGTILKVYAGKGNADGSPFITLTSNCMIQNLTIWYPEQNFDFPVAYPPTCQGGSHYQLENITFVNSYTILKQGPNMSGCPNLTNIYGTPLFIGLDMDGVADIGRLDEMHFAPDYWINSGLPGSPKTEEEQESLREYLYYYGIGVILRRIDWSYLSFTDITGYATGLSFDMSHCYECFENGVRWKYDFPNGHCYGLTFEDCQVAIYVAGTSEWGYGEMVTSSVIKNCEIGIKLGNVKEGEGGNIQFSDMDISATDTAILQQGLVKVNMMGCTIREGAVVSNNGVFAISNTTFLTEAPHVVMENGTCGAVLAGNFDADGNPIQYVNEGLCPISFDPDPVEMEEIPVLSAEKAAQQIRKPAKDVAYIAEGLDGTGATDVTAALQAELNRVKTAGGGALYLPNGTYRLDGSITIPSGVELKGACDIGRIPYNAGTTLAVYGGVNDPNAAPTVILEANSGIRGITFDYPEQYPFAETFVSYPYALQGRGENVYIINISLRNGYNGVDLMSYRCDNHYVEYLAGICVNNSIKVGGGSKGGYIRNYQFNYGAYHKGSETGYGNWPNSPDKEDYDAFLLVMKSKLQHDSVIIEIGDVEDQLLFDNFSYAGGSNMLFSEENGQSANALIYGQGCDAATRAVEVNALENVTFVNLQLVAFNILGDALEKKMYDFQFNDSFDGEMTVFNFNTWAWPDCTFNIQNGTLNMYGANMTSRGGHLATVSKKGTLNITGALINREGAVTYAGENHDRINLNVAINVGDFSDGDKLATHKNVIKRITRWDAPQNAQLDQNSTMLFTEGFTGYNNATSQSFKFETSGENATVKATNGTLKLYLNANAASVGIRNSLFTMNAGRADSLYRVETRLNIQSLRDCEFSQVMVALYTNSGSPAYLVTFAKDGNVLVGGKSIGKFSLDTWYRLAFEVDMRDPVNKTYKVYLLDDEYKTVASSSAVRFENRFQKDEILFTGFWIGAMADVDEGGDTTADLTVDYAFATYSTKSTFGSLGDVDGDGKITSTDARLTLQYYAGKIKENNLNTGVADVDSDGKITSTDARLILQYYAGKITAWP